MIELVEVDEFLIDDVDDILSSVNLQMLKAKMVTLPKAMEHLQMAPTEHVSKVAFFLHFGFLNSGRKGLSLFFQQYI